MQVTKDSIKTKLLFLGLSAHSKIEIHTKSSTFGYIVNKEYDTIDVFMAIITNGVIITPAHTGEWSDPETWGKSTCTNTLAQDN